jgi:hypothetical protein
MGARVFRPLKSKRSGRDARAPLLDSRLFGLEARHWIPAFAGMTGWDGSGEGDGEPDSRLSRK